MCPMAPRTLRPHRTKRPPERRLNSHQRGYTPAWEKASAAWLQDQFSKGHVYCAGCGGLLDGARKDIHVDHKVDHKGDMDVFWDQSGWQAMHAACHSRKTARENRIR